MWWTNIPLNNLMGLDNNCNGDRSVLGYHYKVHKLIDREKTEAGEGLYF
jgi:hypothetical protein